MIANISTLWESPRGCSKIREKELIRAYKVLEEDLDYGPGAAKTYVDCRLYMGRSASSSVVYCLIWTFGDSLYGFGVGEAGGYGYDKQSAAVGSAIDDSGITLADESGSGVSISGVGETAIREALRAIATALGASDHALLVETYP